MIRVLIADDHEIVRRGLKQILAADGTLTLVGEASNHDEIVDLAGRVRADVIILDLNMPGQSGLETLKELRKDHPRTPVIILSMHSEDQYAVRAIRSGAAGYINKEAAPEDLVAAIRKVQKGGKFIGPHIAELLAQHLEKDFPAEPHLSLSNRELEVFTRLAGGETVGGISIATGLSSKTISTYRTRLLQKMEMTTNAEVTRYAIDHKLI